MKSQVCRLRFGIITHIVVFATFYFVFFLLLIPQITYLYILRIGDIFHQTREEKCCVVVVVCRSLSDWKSWLQCNAFLGDMFASGH